MIKKKYIVAYYGWSQYADGITGINYTNLVYIENGQPFDTRAEAKQFALDNKIKTNKKRGKKYRIRPGWWPLLHCTNNNNR